MNLRNWIKRIENQKHSLNGIIFGNNIHVNTHLYGQTDVSAFVSVIGQTHRFAPTVGVNKYIIP